MKTAASFPPSPRSFRGRASELRTLAGLVQTGGHLAGPGAKIALVGAGGSGKSTLACALGHRVRRAFRGKIQWFRIGAWDVRTLAAMMASRLGVRARGADPLKSVGRALAESGPWLVVLDNHEDDAATAALLDGLRDAPVTWVITARRCLLSGVTVFPVVPPLVTLGKSPFPRIASITRLLRWNPVALDLADALVEAGVTTSEELGKWLISKGIERVRPVEHEDDLPEVALLTERAWAALPAGPRRMLGVLAHMGGDHMDVESLAALSRPGGMDAESLALSRPVRSGVTSQRPATALPPRPMTSSERDALARLVALRLVQKPMAGRFTLHATVRHAVLKRTTPLPDRLFEHYVSLLTRDPSRVEIEQTHLFAAMDHAQATGNLQMILRAGEIAETS